MKARKPEDVVLNPRLIAQQELSPEEVKRIQELHVLKDHVFSLMETSERKVELRLLAKIVENIEFAQQDYWGFPLDESFHFWYRVPKCTCPKMDNEDSWGIPNQRIVVSDCPIHWTEEMQANFDKRQV